LWDKNTEKSIIVLRDGKNNWDFFESIMHEVHHAVEEISSAKGMIDELEAKAYLFEYLFRNIRRKLNVK
jgi:hypothetical protein